MKLERAVQLTLGLLLFLLPWQTILLFHEPIVNGSKWEFGVQGLYATEVLFWIAAMLFFFWYWKQKKQAGERAAFRWSGDRLFVLSCLVFTLYLFLSILWAADPSLALQYGQRVLQALLLFFMLFFGPLSLSSAIKWFVAGAAIQALIGIAQFATQSTIASTLLGMSEHASWVGGTSVVAGESIGRWLRAYGSFSHPNVFGGYLVLALILSQIRFKNVESEFKNLEPACRTGRFRIWNLDWSLFVQLLLIAGIFFSFSRTAWAALTLFLVLSFFWKRIKILDSRFYIPDSKFYILSIALVTLLTILFFPLVSTRLSHQSTLEVRSTAERLTGYEQAQEIIGDYLWFGVGAGNYTAEMIARDPALPGWAAQPVHSVPVLLMVELGLIGIALILLTIWMWFRYTKYNTRNTIYVLIPYVVLLLPDHYLASTYTGLMLSAVFLGLLARSYQHSLHGPSTR